MKMALQGNTLKIIEADNVQFTIIKSWGKKTQQLTGTADMELLDKLASIVKLPPMVAERRSQLHAVQDAVDRERVNEDPTPLVNYPVKLDLFRHQIRGANMCLLTFGWVQPEGGAVV